MHDEDKKSIKIGKAKAYQKKLIDLLGPEKAKGIKVDLKSGVAIVTGPNESAVEEAKKALDLE